MRIRSIVPGLAAVAVGAASFAGSPTPQDIASRSTEANYSTAQPKADMTVNITGPAGVYVGAPGTYQVVAANIGNRNALDVRVAIALPRTHTSPVVHILGTLGAYDSRCTLSGTNLNCILGTVNRNSSKTVAFTIALPQSSAPLVVSASVTTQSLEVTGTNNNDSDTAFLLHQLFPLSVGDTAHVEHCTGTGLTSFFECTLYPSSISSHDFTLDSATTLAFIGAPASYHGTWSQSAGTDRLLLEYYDGASHEATFDGYSVGPSRCFEGVTVFHPPSAYVAPYRVCF